MLDLNKLTLEQLQDVYFKEYGYEPSSSQSRVELLEALKGYTPVSLKDCDLINV